MATTFVHKFCFFSKNIDLYHIARFTDKFGLPDNQRIIDPKKGPVKKAATVRKLPKLRNSSGSEESNKSSNGSR